MSASMGRAVAGQPFEARWIGPESSAAPSIVMLPDAGAPDDPWGGFAARLAEATRCGVVVCSRPGGVSGAGPPSEAALAGLRATLDAVGFERGLLLGHGAGGALATAYAGGISDHRVRGLVLIDPRFHGADGAGGAAWDIRESVGYIRVPIQLVRGDAAGAASAAEVEAADEEAYCPVEVATIAGAGRAPHLERPGETLDAVAGFVETLLVAAGEGAGFPLEERDHGR